MSMKKSDLDKLLAKKIGGHMKAAGASGRYGQGAAEVVDRREQRRLDAAAGLVPFACKLPADLLAALRERAGSHAGGMNGLVAEREPVVDRVLAHVAVHGPRDVRRRALRFEAQLALGGRAEVGEVEIEGDA